MVNLLTSKEFVMRKDHVFTLCIIVVIIGIVFILTRSAVLTFASNYPLVMSFFKFFFLASIGDLIGYRLQKKEWSLPPKFLHKAIVWGIIGIVIYLMFQIYPSGVNKLQSSHILPGADSPFLTAFFVSLFMNYTFAPTMMTVHRMTDTYFNSKSQDYKPTFIETVNLVDWGSFFRFTLFRAIPLFWIPAHTITFLIPAEYRIIFAALLGIALGLILRLTAKNK